MNIFEKIMTVLGKEKYVKREYAALYLGARCFVEYVLAKHGSDKLHMLMSCTKGNASDRLRYVFGTDVEIIDRDWKQWVANFPHE